MKKIFPFLAMLMFASPAYSQKIKTRKIERLPLEQKAYFPDFGRNRKEILLSGPHQKGLSLYNTRKKEYYLISEADGAGSEIFTDDAGMIIFSEQTIQNGKIQKDYKLYDPEARSISSVENPLPHFSSIKTQGKKIIIQTPDGKESSISPIEDKFYIWASLSPNGRKILFTAAGSGTYVSDLNGNILSDLGYINSPEWINDHWVVGMDDKDDGEQILSSEIVAQHIESGKSFNLTEKIDAIAQYPKVSPERNRLVFHSLEGEIYLLKFRLRD